MKYFLITTVLLATIFSNITSAQDYITSGEIKSINHSDETISIKHKVISKLALSAMTTDFKVAEQSLMQQIKKGQEVNFTFTVNRLWETRKELHEPKKRS